MLRPSRSASQRAAATRRWWPLVFVALLSTLGALVAAEVAVRLAHGDLTDRPSPAAGVRMIGDRYPASYHPVLGYVPTPGASGRDNPWRARVTIAPDGVRGNGANPTSAGPIALAVGDSFTFGDEVDDAQTWPAQLERVLGRPVVNGGVFGYGFDQITLRAEQLLERIPAEVLIVSIAAEDVLRCEFSYRYAWKPYFDVGDGALVLRNVPVPPPDRAPPGEAWPRSALRASFLADFVMRRLDPDGWLLPDSIRVHRRGVEVGRLLVDRLAALAHRQRVALLLVVQWVPGANAGPARGPVERARARDIEVLELEPALRAEIDAGRARLESLYRIHAKAGQGLATGHMSGVGNAHVARAIAARLRALRVGADASLRAPAQATTRARRSAAISSGE